MPRSSPESPAKKFVDSQQPEPSNVANNSKAKRNLTKAISADGAQRYPAAVAVNK